MLARDTPLRDFRSTANLTNIDASQESQHNDVVLKIYYYNERCVVLRLFVLLKTTDTRCNFSIICHRPTITLLSYKLVII